MTSNALEKLLTEHAAAVRDGSRLDLESGKATFFVRIGSQSMPIDRVVSVDLADGLCTLSCARGEVYAVAMEDVAAIRFEPPKSSAGLL